jgi:hypothetical protein
MEHNNYILQLMEQLDFKCTVIVQYYSIVPLKRGHSTYKTISVISEEVAL